MLIAPMVRRLAPGIEYTTFRAAWLPDEILPGDPRTRVISALNLEDPQELITLALIERGEPSEIPAWLERIAPIEERRQERIQHLVTAPSLNAIYHVVAEDDLSQPLSAWR
jgi:hypothetical protein